MRIVITQNGEDFRNQLQESLKFNKAKSRSNSRSISNKKRKKNKAKLYNKLEMSQRSQESISEFIHEQENMPNKAKELQVSAKKIIIPKTIIEKYNADKAIKDNISILPSIKLPELNKDSSYNSSPKLKGISNGYLSESYKLKELIPHKIIQNMKKDILIREKNKNLMYVMHSGDFRTKNKNEQNNNKIEEGLNRELNVDRGNLIAYINTKTNISDLFIRNMANYDENRLKNLNKACQKILNNQQQELIFKEYVKEYLKKEKIKEAEEYKDRLNILEKNIFNMKHYIDKNQITYNKMDRYEDVHRDIVKGWEEQNLNRFYHLKDNKLNSSYSTTLNNTTIIVNNSVDSIAKTIPKNFY